MIVIVVFGVVVVSVSSNGNELSLLEKVFPSAESLQNFHHFS